MVVKECRINDRMSRQWWGIAVPMSLNGNGMMICFFNVLIYRI